MLKIQKLRVAVIAAVAAAGLTLTGCSAGGQSVAEACASINSTMEKSSTEMNSALQKIMAGSEDDKKDAQGLLKKFSETLSGAVNDVKNDEVKNAAKPLSDLFGKFTTVIADAADNPAALMTPEFQSFSTDMQAAGQKFSELCVTK